MIMNRGLDLNGDVLPRRSPSLDCSAKVALASGLNRMQMAALSNLFDMRCLTFQRYNFVIRSVTNRWRCKYLFILFFF